MESNYRIPDISEFIEGFEYQIKHSLGFDIIDFSNPEKNIKGEMKDYWFDNVVPNLDPITYPHTITNDDGSSWTFMGADRFEEDPLRVIKILLENGNIRVKLNK